MNDKKLAARLKKKDERALEEVIEKFTPIVSTIVYNVSKGLLTKEDMEETVTDIFMTLWNNADKIMEDKLKGYVCRIAKTRAMNKVSSVHAGTVFNIDDYDPEDDFSIEAETEKKDVAKELREIIREIGQPDREILIRYYYYSQTTGKISEVMELNHDTVRSKLRRTRDKIKTKLLERGYTL